MQVKEINLTHEDLVAAIEDYIYKHYSMPLKISIDSYDPRSLEYITVLCRKKEK